MKKVIKQNFTKKKIDKNTIYAYILLIFFIFWTVGSIFGFIAFGRKDKQSNVVSASANVVEDFSNAGAINLFNAYQNGTFTSEDGNTAICNDVFIVGVRNEYTINLTLSNKNVFSSSYGTVFTLDWLCDDLVDGGEYLVSFIIDSPDTAFVDLPLFQMYEYDENDEFFDNMQFEIEQNSFGLPARYTYRLFYNEGWSYFIKMSAPAGFNLANRNNLYLFSPTVVNYYVTIGNYVFTLDELHDIYEAELYKSFLDGASSQTAYQDGYSEGYKEAMYVVNTSIYSFFGSENCTFTLELNDTTLSTPLLHKSVPDLYIYDFVTEGLSNLGLSLADTRNGLYHLTFTSFPSDLILLPSYEFKGYTDLIFADDAPIPFDSITLTTNKGTYVSTRSWTPGNNYMYNINLDNLQPDEQLLSIDIFGYMSTVSNRPILKGYDYRYLLGFEFGYIEAFDSFERKYDYYLNQKYNEGVAYGKQVGYGQGYNEGAEAGNEFTFTKLLTAVVDVPINAFKSLFNFEILGVNLTSFFFSMFTIALVLAIIKLII